MPCPGLCYYPFPCQCTCPWLCLYTFHIHVISTRRYEYLCPTWTAIILSIPKAFGTWHGNLKSLPHQRGRAKAAEKSPAAPFKAHIPAYRLIPLSVRSISLEPPFISKSVTYHQYIIHIYIYISVYWQMQRVHTYYNTHVVGLLVM
jgi:hypothetical protein